MKKTIFILLFVLITVFQGIGQSSPNRTAFLVGNSNYVGFALKKPEKDADAIAASLQNLGFSVVHSNNLSKEEFDLQLSAFKSNLSKNKGIGLFFFSGYGLHAKGENYLIPSNAFIGNEDEFEEKAISLKKTIREIESSQNDLNLIILDIYPDCPFIAALDTSKNFGIKVELSSRKTILVYSYLPGSIPCNCFVSGLFAREFIAALQIENINIGDFLKIVKRNVTKNSRSKQIPWDNASGQDFIIHPTTNL